MGGALPVVRRRGHQLLATLPAEVRLPPVRDEGAQARVVSRLAALMLAVAAFAVGVSAREILPARPRRPCYMRVHSIAEVGSRTTVWTYCECHKDDDDAGLADVLKRAR